jgi:branched-chain amino acid transport system ATP-binding protein
MIETKGITVRFGGLTAVNQVSLKLHPNKINSLIGPNGAGKTTFFNAISGVYTPNEGEILFKGQNIEKKRGFEICEAGISRTYQIINLFWEMTALENVMVGMTTRLNSNFWQSLFKTKKQQEEEKEAYKKAMELLEFVGLEEYAHKRASELSYGNQRLLEIVRAMATGAEVLLLDEPAAGMNSIEKRELDVLLKRILDRGVTILLVEHDMKLVMNVSDYIFVMANGSLLAKGVPEEVQTNQKVIDAYLGGDD